MLEYIYDDELKLVELRKELQAMISQCDIDLPDEPEFSTSQDTLTRFLRARNYDVKEAYKQLKSTLEWRRQYRPTSVKCSWCEETPGFHSMRQIGHDKLGRPIVYACFAQAQTNRNSVEDSIAHTVYLIENAKKTMENNASMWVFVIDCTGMTLPCCNPKLGFGVAQACGLYYPERLGKILVINHSMMFHHVWQAIRVFVDAKTITKLKLIKNNIKMDKHFSSIFDEETSQWLKEEIKLNQQTSSNLDQQKFWLQRQDHDPRGTKTYVNNFIIPLSQNKDESKLHKNTHLPHPNILKSIMGEEVHLNSRDTSKDMVNLDDPKLYELNEEVMIEKDGTSSENNLKDINTSFKHFFNKFKI